MTHMCVSIHIYNAWCKQEEGGMVGGGKAWRDYFALHFRRVNDLVMLLATT